MISNQLQCALIKFVKECFVESFRFSVSVRMERSSIRDFNMGKRLEVYNTSERWLINNKLPSAICQGRDRDLNHSGPHYTGEICLRGRP